MLLTSPNEPDFLKIHLACVQYYLPRLWAKNTGHTLQFQVREYQQCADEVNTTEAETVTLCASKNFQADTTTTQD